MADKTYSKKWYLFCGLFFLCLGIFILWRNTYYSISDYSIFWFSNLAPFILALGFLMRSDNMVKGVLNITFFLHILFLYGALMMFFFSIDVFGVGLSLAHLNIWIIVSSVFSHVSLIGAYFLNNKAKPTYKSLIYSFVFLVIMYFIAISQTPIEENVNYVFVFDYMGFVGFTYMYIPLAFFIVVLPTYFFQVFMWKLWIHNNRKN